MKQINKSALKVFLCFLVLFLCHDLRAQLSPFTLNVTSSPQTCLGNGSLSFITTGTTTGANIDYKIYLLPDTTTPVTIVTANVANGLVAGNYQVVATQSLGGFTNTATASAVIFDNVVPLTYTLLANSCLNNGTITVTVTSGNAVSYEIIAGPQTRPLQSSNIFINLPLGLYTVRVFNNCGNAVVVDVNMQVAPFEFFIGYTGVSEGPLPACDTISVGNYISSNYAMLWPVTLTLTVDPPGGGANVVVTKTIYNYPPNNIEYVDIPYYYGQGYTYNLTVTDACGNSETTNAIIQPTIFDFTLATTNLSCNDFALMMDMSVYKTPCTVSFTSGPPGFNPSLFNASHPVFNADNIVYGSAANPMPHGNYTVKITDACGHSATKSITITNQGIPVVSSGVGYLSTCHGYFTVKMPFGRGITSAVITIAPDNYEAMLPQNVMEFASGDTLTVSDIPAGTYTVALTDSCGEEHTITVVIVAGPPVTGLSVDTLPGCEENEGSMSIYSIRFTEVIIIEAPEEFEYLLPYDASANIWDAGFVAGFSMGSLPPGSYTMQFTDDCGNIRLKSFEITAYQVYSDDIEIIPGCGSFNVEMNYLTNSTPNFVEKFWLQKYNEDIGMWINPSTSSVYEEGTPVYAANAVEINNYTSNYFAYSGKFRIMRVLGSYSDPGSQGSYVKYCTKQIYEFTYYDNPHINSAYGFSCGDGTSDVIIDADGLAPLQYEITSKNGEPFNLDNGTSSFFPGLENGTYNFRVTDGCNNFLNIQYDITILQPFTISSSGICEGQSGSLNVKGFSFLQYEWWKEGAQGAILSTDSTLDFGSFQAADIGTYFVHITATVPDSCIDQILSIQVEVELRPHAGEDYATSLCNDGQVLDLNQYLQSPYDLGGAWSDVDFTGKLQQNILFTNGLAAGTYNFKYSVENVCGISDESTITLTFGLQPETPIVTIGGPVCEGSSLLLTAETVEGVSYNWTGPNGFVSHVQNPVLQNISAEMEGVYTLSIVLNGTVCPSVPVSVSVIVNKIPDFTIEGNTLLCGNEETTLIVNAFNFDNNVFEHDYTWYHNNEQMISKSWFIQTSEPGVYKVIVDTNGCYSEKEITVTKNELSLVLQSGCVENAYIIDTTSAIDLSDAAFVWTGPDGYVFTGAKADITNLKTGEYAVTVTIGDGCTAFASVIVDNTSCIISKGVSPNGDGLNDYFDLSLMDVEKIEIFNRYGLIIYDATNYKKEWHGQTNGGKEVPTGTYYYSITLSTGKQVTGWVYLQR